MLRFILWWIGGISKPNLKQPTKVEYSTKCDAEWQVTSCQGVSYLIKCRKCGTYLASGGTPKCLINT